MLRAWLKNTAVLRNLAVFGVAVASSVLMTWPLARDAWDSVLAAAFYWDAYTNTMIMGARVDAALGRGPLSFYDNYFFAPLPYSIVFNENHFGLSLLFAPFYLFSKNPLWAYNCTLLLSLVLSVHFTYLLVRRLTGNDYAGIISGVAFAFSPYVFFEIGRIQLVATQWIPACFLLLHRAIEERRLRDVVGFWVCYLLQIGTCLYYAMFLLPLLGLLGATVLARTRPPRRLYLQFAAGAAVAGGVALAMVRPYFSARDSFFLERSLGFASSYDGKLGFFANVPPTNLTLTALHHQGQYIGAHEEIAFPGFTVLLLVLGSLGVSLFHTARALGVRAFGIAAARWFAILVLTIAATFIAKSALAGVVVVGLGMWWQWRSGTPTPFAAQRGLYLGVLLLAVVMFLGLEMARWNDVPIRGLYYYFHTYFPGFNGIRKVSRQAIMTTFAFTVLAGFGAAWLLSRVRGHRAKLGVTALFLAASCFELRSFPHAMQTVWAGASVPRVYDFVSTLPERDLVSIVPQNAGVSRFRGDAGLALHNYLAIYHRHRFVNGQSSWMPPITELVRRATSLLPDDGARRALLGAGVDHILIHGADLYEQQKELPARLAADPQHYRLAFEDGADKVFTLLPGDEVFEPLDTPSLPEGAELVSRQEMQAFASVADRFAGRAIDGELGTAWASGPRVEGQFLELRLKESRRIVAFEIHNPSRPMEVPLAYAFSVGQGLPRGRGEPPMQTMVSQPFVRLFREQIYSPKTFVFRVVLPEPTLADRVRITAIEPVPGHEFVVQEARLYAEPR